MTLLKCKMCGGALDLKHNETVAECPYCGIKQTVPNLDDDRKAQMFDRANRLRSACSFDRAIAAYENIIGSFPEEAEAYWGELLCKYGIEYVDDPATGKKIPTSHRSSYESVMDDEAYEMTMEYASPSAKQIYREEAKTIENIRKGIIAVSSKEEPYDIFICYKENDDTGNRSLDSVLAQDVYEALTDKGYRVFFSRISLEDKIGKEYEPYIFAALNSAKVMLVFGTKNDHFNSIWVKNEWSRYLDLMSRDKNKYLIPCFKNMDIYDLPKEFAKFQAQDLGKVGAIQDLIRGIEKILKPSSQTNHTKPYQNAIISQSEQSQSNTAFRTTKNTKNHNILLIVSTLFVIVIAMFIFVKAFQPKQIQGTSNNTSLEEYTNSKSDTDVSTETVFMNVAGDYTVYAVESEGVCMRLKDADRNALEFVLNEDGTGKVRSGNETENLLWIADGESLILKELDGTPIDMYEITVKDGIMKLVVPASDSSAQVIEYLVTPDADVSSIKITG